MTPGPNINREIRAARLSLSVGGLLAIAALTLGGCFVKNAPKIVEVPVTRHVYCDPGPLQEPAMPIAALKPDAPPADTMRAYASTVAMLKGEVVRRDILLDSCRAPQGLTPAPSIKGNY